VRRSNIFCRRSWGCFGAHFALPPSAAPLLVRRILSWVVAGGIVLAWNQYSNRDNGQVVDNTDQAKWNERIVAREKQVKAPPKAE
jgi:hypothetical protein